MTKITRLALFGAKKGVDKCYGVLIQMDFFGLLLEVFREVWQQESAESILIRRSFTPMVARWSICVECIYMLKSYLSLTAN